MPTPYGMRERRDSLEPILVALEHIEARGSLLTFTHDHSQRARLMKAMTELELVIWNVVSKEYEMTSFGCQCLAQHRGIAGWDFTQSGVEMEYDHEYSG
jgi:hypothetical protein